MNDDFPRSVDSITNTWLSEVLGGPVTGFKTTFLEGGVLSEAYRLHDIAYAAGTAAGAPRSVVIKLSQQEQEQRDAALDVNAYAKELNFFRQLAAEVPICTPKVFGVFADGSENSEYFSIVLEDLTTHSKVFDQVDDRPDEAFTRKIALEIAKLHAKYWDSPVLDEPWISVHRDRYVFPGDALSRASPENIDKFRSMWDQSFGEDLLRKIGNGTEELTAILTGPKCNAIHDHIYDVLSERPRTLIHGDLRADNIFRTHPDLGKSVEDSEVTFIDWQLLTAGPPGPEFTQAWQHSLAPAVRRKDKEFLKQYHDALVSLNPAAEVYAYDMLVEDYVLGFCFWWSALISLGITVLPDFDAPENARGKALWGQCIPYMLQAMVDHDCLSIIRQIVGELPSSET